MLMRHLAAISMLVASTGVLADNLDINLSNDTAQFQYGTSTATGTEGTTDLHAGFLYNNASSVLINAGIMVRNGQGGGLTVGGGVEAVAATMKDNPPTTYNASAVAIDLLGRYSPPEAYQFGFAVGLHYAPRIITFGDADHFQQVDARVEFEISPQTVIYAGYRKITFGLKNKTDDVMDNGGHIGIKLAF